MAKDNKGTELKAGDIVTLRARVLISHPEVVTLQLIAGEEPNYEPQFTIYGGMMEKEPESESKVQTPAEEEK